MNLYQDIPSESVELKLLAAIIAAIVAANLSACGISAGGVTVGTTGFLREVNAGRGAPMDSYTETERAKLGAIARR